MRFDQFAHSYDLHAIPQRAFAGRVAAFAAIEAGQSVLELGAGTGALTAHLVDRGARVQATDGSSRMVEIGRTSVPRAQWSVLDAFDAAVPAAEVQISSGLLQWAREPDTVLRSWAAGLASGGRMIHGMPCDPCLKEWRELVPESPVRWRDQSGWLELFRGSGLRVTRSELWTMQLQHASALDMLRSLHQSGVTGSARLRAGELRRALARYDALHRGPGGGVVSTWAWLAIEAMAV